jgi:hypothetical protein
MHKLTRHINLTHWLILSLVIIDLLFFGKTDSSNVPSFLLVIGFLLLIITAYMIVYSFLGVARLYGLPLKRKKRLSAYIIITFGLIFALQSMGELSAKDILVIIPIAVIGYIYTSYFKTDNQQIE